MGATATIVGVAALSTQQERAAPTSTNAQPQQRKQQQDAAEGCFGGEKLLQAKVIGGQIVLQFGDAIFHVRPVVVVSPEFFRRERQVADEDAKGIAITRLQS